MLDLMAFNMKVAEGIWATKALQGHVWAHIEHIVGDVNIDNRVSAIMFTSAHNQCRLHAIPMYALNDMSS